MTATAEQTGPSGRGAMPGRRPSAARYGWAALLVVLGVISALVWLGLASAAANKHANGYARTAAPGTISLRVSQPRTYYVYVEGTSDTLRDLALTVIDPFSQNVAVTAISSRSYYDHHGMFGHAVGSFKAARSGEYRVTATGHLNPYGDFAVGDNAAGRMIPHLWGVGTLLVLTIGSAFTLAVVTVLRRRQHRPVHS